MGAQEFIFAEIAMTKQSLSLQTHIKDSRIPFIYVLNLSIDFLTLSRDTSL